jgi:uncharacterized membrane protein HdeD (DUF308 family)
MNLLLGVAAIIGGLNCILWPSTLFKNTLPNFKKNQRKKRILIWIGVCLVILGLVELFF